MQIVISNIIKSQRIALGITQEKLAEKMGVSVQAVSKWENGISYPDIALLPELAEYFDVTVDFLLTGKESVGKTDLPDDKVFRVVQAIGNKIIDKTEYKADKVINMKLSDNDSEVLNVEIWGSLNLEGSINGDVSCMEPVTCGNVGGNLYCMESVTCENVGGDVYCTTIKGNIECNGKVITNE